MLKVLLKEGNHRQAAVNPQEYGAFNLYFCMGLTIHNETINQFPHCFFLHTPGRPQQQTTPRCGG